MKCSGKQYEMSERNTLANNMKGHNEIPWQLLWNALATIWNVRMKCSGKQYEMSERNTLANDMKCQKEMPWQMIWNAPTVYEKGPGIKWMKNIGQTNEMPLIKFCGCIHTGWQALACSLW